MTTKATGVAPVTSAERIGEMDVLRGFALLGVLLANLGWWSFTGFTATDAQRGVWMADTTNQYSLMLLNTLVSDKANTLFATLFGIGFWVMMERLKAKGGDFNRIYLRRLTILAIAGFAHLYLIWPWDILHMYALMGFVLFALRGLSMRAMLWIGLPLAIFARPAIDYWRKVSGLEEMGHDMVFSPAATEARQQVILNGDYWSWVQEYARVAYYDYWATYLFVAWWLYVLGRFLIGAWIARKGWLSRTTELLPQIRKIFYISFPVGLALEALATGVEFDMIGLSGAWTKFIHFFGVPILDIGYATGLILLFHSKNWAFFPKMFAPVGRMALTNYIMQSFLYLYLVTGVGPGLAMVGQISPPNIMLICFAFFAAQIVFSHWWLARYRFGPLEWCWRALTYGEKPRMRIATA